MPEMFDSKRLLALTLLVALLGGCQTPPPEPPPTDNEPIVRVVPEEQTTAPLSNREALVQDHRQLVELFRGTPVVFSLLGDGSLRIGVPMKYCFEPGRAVVKPALGMLLNRLATSQKKLTTQVKVTAPADPDGIAPQLAKFRAISVRDYLMARGVGYTRFAPPVSGKGNSVELLLYEPPSVAPTATKRR